MDHRRSRLRRAAFIFEVAAIGAMTIAGLASALYGAWLAAPEFFRTFTAPYMIAGLTF